MTDPRIMRTQRELFAALDILLAEKSFSEINVSDLAKRAKVGRQTFYRHFNSVGDMLSVRLRLDLADQIELAQQAGVNEQGAADWSIWVTRFAFERVAEQPHIARAILSGEAGENALSAFRDQIMALNLSAPNDPYSNIPSPLKNYVSMFHAGAVLAVLLHWIDSGCSPDAETMSRLVVKLNDTSGAEWDIIDHNKAPNDQVK